MKCFRNHFGFVIVFLSVATAIAEEGDESILDAYFEIGTIRSCLLERSIPDSSMELFPTRRFVGKPISADTFPKLEGIALKMTAVFVPSYLIYLERFDRASAQQVLDVIQQRRDWKSIENMAIVMPIWSGNEIKWRSCTVGAYLSLFWEVSSG